MSAGGPASLRLSTLARTITRAGGTNSHQDGRASDGRLPPQVVFCRRACVGTRVRLRILCHNATLYIKLPGGRVQTLKGEKEELRITVVEARGLPQMDMGAGTTEEERAQDLWGW